MRRPAGAEEMPMMSIILNGFVGLTMLVTVGLFAATLVAAFGER
jgi:hypothetical protein